MEKINVLVLGVGGNVSQGICKALRNSDLNCHIIGACIAPTSVGLYFCDEAIICPYANDNEFLPWLIEICGKMKVNVVLTGVEENIIAIMREYDVFSTSTKAKFIAADYDMLMIGQDKLSTCEWLKSNNCNYPRYCKSGDCDELIEFASQVGFPMIAKPRKGKGSSGILMINNIEELKRNYNLDNYVFQEYIGSEDEEYTVGSYTDKNNNIMPLIIMKRMLNNGGTSYAKVINNSVIYDEALKICKCFNSKGPLNIQMRLDKNGRPVCFELNVRFSGTTPIRANFGFKDVEALILEYIMNEPIDDKFVIIEGECYRYINEIYLKNDATEFIKTNKKCDDLQMLSPKIERMGK